MTRKYNRPGLQQRIRGFSLIEAMIAMVVLSVGLLGVAGLQMSGMRSVQGAQYRTDATRLAEGLLDRMRANMPGVRPAKVPTVRNGAYQTSDVATTIGSSTKIDCSSTACTPENIATNDLIAWYSELQELMKLPVGTPIKASVICSPNTCDTDSAITVAVAWHERNEDKKAAVDDQLVIKSFILNTVL